MTKGKQPSGESSRRNRAVIRVIVVILVLMILTSGVVVLVQNGLGTGTPLMVVSSGSMIPVLRPGDLIIVRGINPDAVTVGTIIIFHSPDNYNMFVVHRVVEVEKNGTGIFFRTKGDNNPEPDWWTVPESDLMGTLFFSIPEVGFASLWLRGPPGFVLIGLLIVALVAIEYRKGKGASEKVEES